MTPPDTTDTLFDVGGEMAGRLAAFPWERTPLGPPNRWPESLRTTVTTLLHSRFPMLLCWGRDLVMLYNDGYIPTLGDKHPAVLGGPLREAWADIWDVVGPLEYGVLEGGPPIWAQDQLFLLERGHGPEEAFYTYSASHVPDPNGAGGVLAVMSETTGSVVSARRMALLNSLSRRLGTNSDPDEAAAAALRTLAGAPEDLVQGGLVRLAREAPPQLMGSFGQGELTDDDLCRIAETAADGTALWPAGSTTGRGGGARAVALPLRGDDAAALAIVTVPNPLRPLDEEHLTFLTLVADQVAQVIADATARAQEKARLEALAALDAAKTAVLSNVSHEFRTPLTLILGPLEDHLNGRTDALDAPSVAAMHEQALRLLHLVDGLIAVARMETESATPSLVPVDVAALTHDVLQIFDPAVRRAGLTLTASTDLADPVADLDPALWDRIVVNLVGNALKYTRDGTIEVALSEVADPEPRLVLTVADTGVGIAPEEQPRIFDRFHRVAGETARTIEGTGIGLALVADAVRGLGGTVDVTSRPGQGTTFTVALPLRRSTSPQSEAVTRSARDAATYLALSRGLIGDDSPEEHTLVEDPDERPVILVVDDNPGVRERVLDVIGEWGRGIAARDGVEALTVLERASVDLVVTDVMMPRMDGLELLRRIRADDRLSRLPVILLSARAGAEAVAEAADAGADDYVVKPFTPVELRARCRSTLELAQHRRRQAEHDLRQTMLAGISHDMQTPLAILATTLQLMQTASLTDEQRVVALQRAESRLRYLQGLVSRFIDWSRISVGSALEVEPRPTDLGPLLNRICDDRPGVVIDGDPTARVLCDPLRTERILHNLLDNAAAAGATQVQVRVRRAQEGLVLVQVSDDAGGFTPEARAAIFAPFTSSTSSHGSGLGLYVSRENARAQGGDVTLDDSGPRGSSLTLTLKEDV